MKLRLSLALSIVLSCTRSAPPCAQDGGCASTMDAQGTTDRPGIDWTPPAPRPPPIWQGGAWRLPWVATQQHSTPPCGQGEPIASAQYRFQQAGLHFGDHWSLFLSWGAVAAIRDNAVTGYLEGGTAERVFNPGNAPSGFLMGVSDRRSYRAALMWFRDPWAAGEIWYETTEQRPGSPETIIYNTASDEVTAMVYSNFMGQQLWVGGAHANNMHPLAVPQEFRDFQRLDLLVADGPHVLIASQGEVYLYTRRPDGSDLVENLTHDAIDQWRPAISGRHIVWVDQRDEPRGSAWEPNNPEIYLYDIETRARTRITHDPPSHPVRQDEPTVSGDWIVWSDWRNTAQPNPPPGVVQPVDLYGYHIPTGREVVVARSGPDTYLGGPVLTRDHLWYLCSHSTPRSEGSYRMPRPTLPSSP